MKSIIADKVAAMWVTQLIAMALFARERTGTGQAVEVSMFETIPVRYSATPGSIRRPAPNLGEHTAEVLKKDLS